MNFITFPASSTNIFPAANSTTGSQLVTEWNLKARETVATDPNVSYSIGPSYVHGMPDFEVKILEDAGGAIINPYTLWIAEGRGVINGHYVETLAPMTIDLVEANAKLNAQARPPLKGALAIGIRTFFATEMTIASSILVENEEDMFLGVQLVVLPENEMILPSESPDDPSKVTADIRLATFTFLNNAISGLTNLNSKIQFLTPERIASLDHLVSSKYVSKVGLNSKKLYAFAGKGTEPQTGADTWEDVTDSMIVWDIEPKRVSEKPAIKQATITTDPAVTYVLTNDSEAGGALILPHKQVTGMTDDDGNPEYYALHAIPIPAANYSTSTPGFVTSEYTKQMKSISSRLDDMRNFVNGKQIELLDTRGVDEELPSINDAWNNGDYILVIHDNYYMEAESDTMSAPSTMYVVLPGNVLEVRYITKEDGDAEAAADFPDNIDGVELRSAEWYESSGKSAPDTEYPDVYNTYFWADGEVIRGVKKGSSEHWQDYFRIRYYKADSDTYEYTDYYYGVFATGARAWSDAFMLTGSVSFATEQIIGGFLNASEEALDEGYVYLDETGHLKLLDYSLLRSGTLAYQLGNTINIPTSTDTLSEVQDYLTEYVNDRVAFPSSSNTEDANHMYYTPVIDVYVPLSSTYSGTIEISGIDSRFNTAVAIHITGDATSDVTINIMDCEKLIIDPTISGTPVINVLRCNLYYDPVVINYVKQCYRDTSVYGTFTGFKDLRLWFEALSATSGGLLVNDMTVSEVNSPIITSNIDYWKELGTAINDNNYLVALKSITFSGEGDIIGCEVLAANNSTDNIDPGDKIVVGDFVLPQGQDLVYPIASLTRKLRVTGSFTSAYYSDSNWYVTDNSFTLETGTYSASDTETSMTGTVAFHSVTTLVPSTITQTSISPWEPDSYHLFSGGAIS